MAANQPQEINQCAAAKPDWLRIRPPKAEPYAKVRHLVQKSAVATVCQEAHCPNIAECWSKGTATFMVMGDTCTRACKFCAVKTAFPAPSLNPDEPRMLGESVRDMGIKYAVITSVDRDDLADQGASHLAACIRAVREHAPGVVIEVLIPDFRGKEELIIKIIEARPEVIGHNIETVKSLQKKVRDPRAGYEQSLHVLELVKKSNPSIHTKSSIMLGLGETQQEVLEAMKDLRKIGVTMLTLGQYLRPSDWHLPVIEYITPDKFDFFRKIGEDMGFACVAAGPFVRSSYRAGELYAKHIVQNQKT